MGKYDVLFKYIDLFSDDVFGEWIVDTENDGSMVHVALVARTMIIRGSIF